MKIRSLFIALSAFVCASVFAQSDNNVIDEVIWIVGDEAILKSDVENARMEALQQGQRWEGDPYCVIPEQLAIQKLFLHQAAIDSVEVSDAEVFQQVDRRINYYIQNIGSKEKMEEYFGKTMTQIRDQLYNLIRDDEMTNEVRRSLVKNVKVTPAQVRRYFKDMPEDSIPFVPTKVEVQIITRHPAIPQEEVDRIKDELRSYTERINNGSMKFSTLATMYSEDPGSKVKGGELGFMTRGELVPEFANIAFNLTDTKTVSKIVESEFGFHIIQLIEKKGDMVNVRHILRKPKVAVTAFQDCINMLDTVVMDIKDSKYTFDEAAAISTDKDTRSNYGIMVNPEDGGSKFEMKELAPEVAREVAGMKVGDISKPFIMTNNKGKEVVAIVKLRSRVNGHRATMADDYQALHDVVVGKLNEEKIESWIREKQKTTYVRINDEWRNCEFKYPGWIK
ncbi:MAG: peptidylprolyl isomerase [Prevotellaceae bacterium]|nr:peptidylprolyl isomerase [Candidatus Minthosoma caballi]